MKTAFAKYRLRMETPFNILIHKVNKIVFGIQTADKLKWIKHSNSLKKKYFKDEIWNFNGIRLPDYKPDPTGWLMYSIYMDTLFYIGPN
jgi:hypothetical protein